MTPGVADTPPPVQFHPFFYISVPILFYLFFLLYPFQNRAATQGLSQPVALSPSAHALCLTICMFFFPSPEAQNAR